MKRRTVPLFIGFIMFMAASGFSGNRWPSYVSFAVSSRSELQTVSAIVAIDKVAGSTVFAYATAQEMEKLDSLGYAITIIAEPPVENEKEVKGGIEKTITAQIPMAVADLSAYPTYNEYVALMNQFAAAHPSLCSIENAGATFNGHSLLIARVSSATPNAAKPNVFFAGGIHGDETGGFVLMLKLIDYLLSNYGNIPRVTSIVDNIVLYVNPLANPDGLYYYGDNTICDDSRPDCYLCRFNGNNDKL